MNEPMSEQTGSKLAIPIAIIFAGILVAGALIYTNRDRTPSSVQTGATTGTVSSIPIQLEPVTADDHILGNPNATITVVEYSDTECPFCKDYHNTMHSVINQYGQAGEVAWVYRHFPISQLHSKAPHEAEATECAAELGGNSAFWQYIDLVFERTPSNNGLLESNLPVFAEEIGLDRNRFLSCLESGKYEDKVSGQVEEAQKAGGRGTPFSVLVLQEELNIEQQNFIASAASQLPAQTIFISEDKKKVALNGALPFSLVELILNVMLGKDVEAS